MQLKRFLIALALGFTLLPLMIRAQSAQPSQSTSILVELFTSEGCSSCPPADQLLERLDKSQPIPGVTLIVLSEHVDYWNHIGWRDPYSSRDVSDRQGAYAKRFGLDSVYTPEIVVDGTAEFVGSNSQAAQKTLVAARGTAKIPIHLSAITVNQGVLRAHVEVPALPESLHLKNADVLAAIALDRAESSVSGGENSGRKLTHTSVVRSLVKIGSIGAGQFFSKDIRFNIANASGGNLRLIAFTQEPTQGKVVGATMQIVTRNRQ